MAKQMTAVLLCTSLFLLQACTNESYAPEKPNAFTRAAKEPLSGIVTPVPNPRNIPCNGVMDCRNKRDDLPIVWQLDNNSDYGAKDYPARCHVLGEGGKYVYSAAAC